MRGWLDALATSMTKSVVRGGRADRVTTTVRRESDGESCLLLVGGACLLERGLTAANRVAHSSGAALASNNRLNSARVRRGAGVPAIVPLPYYYDDIAAAIAKIAPRHVILCGCVVPYAAFG
jgi:hypothetical protein